MAKGMARRLARQWESPPVWLLVFLVIAWAQARWLPVWPAGGVWRAAGWALIVGAVLIFVLAVAEFRRARTTILPREEPERMITGGIYRHSRNPIYLADAMILAGAALLQDVGALVLVPVFMAVISRRFIAGEEAALAARFAGAYREWAGNTRRWL